MPLHVKRLLIDSRWLSLLSGESVQLTVEALQPSASFKLRGVGAVCEEQVRLGKRRFISSSGGNAAIAVAYAGCQLAHLVTVADPETTTARARMLIEQEDASLIAHGGYWNEANTFGAIDDRRRPGCGIRASLR